MGELLLLLLAFFAPPLIAAIVVLRQIKSFKALFITLSSAFSQAFFVMITASVWQLVLFSQPNGWDSYQGYKSGLSYLFSYLPSAAFLGIIAGSTLAVIFYLNVSKKHQIRRSDLIPCLVFGTIVSTILGGLVATLLYTVVYDSLFAENIFPARDFWIFCYVLLSGLVGGGISAWLSGKAMAVFAQQLSRKQG